MKLNKVYIRNFPPGLILESTDTDGEKICHEEDFPDLTFQSEAGQFVDRIIDRYPWASRHRDHLTRVIKRVIAQFKKSIAQTFTLESILLSHKLPLTHTAINKDGTKCITGSYDRTAKVWNLHNGGCLATLTGHSDIVYDVTFVGREENVVATGSFDKDIRLWKVPTEANAQVCHGTSPCQAILKKHQGPISVLRECEMNANYEPNLISASLDHSVILWDLEMGDDIGEFIGHKGSVSDISISRSKTFITTVSFDGTAIMWDINTFRMIELFQHDYCQVNSSALDWTDTLLATGTTDSRMMVWDIRNCKRPAFTLNKGAEVVHVSFSKTGRKVAASSVDSTCSIVDTQTFAESLTLREHTGEITMVEFDVSGSRVITTGEDGKIILWDLDQGRPLQVNETHKNPIYSLKMSDSGTAFLTAANDGKCCFWATHEGLEL